MHLDAFVMTATRYHVSHAAGHHRMIRVDHPNFQVVALNVDEAQEPAGVTEEFRLALDNSRRVDMRHVVRNHFGEPCHVIRDKGIAAGLLGRQDFLLDVHLRDPWSYTLKLDPRPDAISTRRTKRSGDKPGATERIGEAIADDVVILDVVDKGRDEIAVIGFG